MDLSALVLLVLPPFAMILFALSITAIVLVPKKSRNGFVVSGAVCVAAGLASAIIMFWMWGVGYEMAESEKHVPDSVDDSMLFGFFTACLAFTALLVTGLLANIRRRQSR